MHSSTLKNPILPYCIIREGDCLNFTGRTLSIITLPLKEGSMHLTKTEQWKKLCKAEIQTRYNSMDEHIYDKVDVNYDPEDRTEATFAREEEGDRYAIESKHIVVNPERSYDTKGDHIYNA